MPLRLHQRRIVLQTTHHVHDAVVREHHLEQGRFVEEQDAAHDLVEVVQAFPVVQVLAHSEEAQEFLDVALAHQRQGEFLPPDGRGQDGRDQVGDFFEPA